MNSTYKVDKVRWAKLDIFNQMGNIYSEVGRSFKTLDQSNSREHKEAIARAIELFNITIESLIGTKSVKAKEVLRAKEQFLELVTNTSATKQSIESLDHYFMQYAIAARLKR